MNSTKCPWGSCIYWGQLTHKVWMKFIQQLLLECVYKLPYFDTFWPEMYDDLHTTRYNTRVLELTNMDLHVFNIWGLSKLLFGSYCVYKVRRLLTSIDFKWHFKTCNMFIVLTKVDVHTRYEVHRSFTIGGIECTRFSDFDLCWHQMTIDLNKIK